ncbi:hypothetical protein LX36DRAFT_704225 [Colletotrichum falcatum]|nr:hypothetical protein LX36DRAFT_704225 [Colletotrichum falcatum]
MEGVDSESVPRYLAVKRGGPSRVVLVLSRLAAAQRRGHQRHAVLRHKAPDSIEGDGRKDSTPDPEHHTKTNLVTSLVDHNPKAGHNDQTFFQANHLLQVKELVPSSPRTRKELPTDMLKGSTRKTSGGQSASPLRTVLVDRSWQHQPLDRGQAVTGGSDSYGVCRWLTEPSWQGPFNTIAEVPAAGSEAGQRGGRQGSGASATCATSRTQKQR